MRHRGLATLLAVATLAALAGLGGCRFVHIGDPAALGGPVLAPVSADAWPDDGGAALAAWLETDAVRSLEFRAGEPEAPSRISIDVLTPAARRLLSRRPPSRSLGASVNAPEPGDPAPDSVPRAPVSIAPDLRILGPCLVGSRFRPITRRAPAREGRHTVVQTEHDLADLRRAIDADPADDGPRAGSPPLSLEQARRTGRVPTASPEGVPWTFLDGVHRSWWQSRCLRRHPRGIVVRLHGLLISPFDAALDRRLLADGWLIVRYEELELGSIGLERTADGQSVTLSIGTPEDAGAVVDRITGRVALAAAAVVRTEFEQLAGEGIDPRTLPVAVVGTSLGGILAPTVAARVHAELQATPSAGGLHLRPSGLDALVLIAAGGDLGAIAASSPAMDLAWADVSAKDAGTLRRWRSLLRTAIDASQLDPLTVAPSLRGVPTLMLHAGFDAVVPARHGEQLWLALGRPTRWTYLAGHYGLLGLLTGEAPAVARWLDRRTRPALD